MSQRKVIQGRDGFTVFPVRESDGAVLRGRPIVTFHFPPSDAAAQDYAQEMAEQFAKGEAVAAE